MPFAIFMLTFSAFGIGTSEYIIMGLLSEIAADLEITIPQAGSLVTMYAMGVVVGGPLLAIITMKLSRKITLLSLMCMFIIGNILCALSTWLTSSAPCRTRRNSFCAAKRCSTTKPAPPPRPFYRRSRKSPSSASRVPPAQAKRQPPCA